MIVECKNCGAPLEVKPGEAFTRCRYCGQTSKVRSARTLMAEKPAGWTPPATWQPPPTPPPPPPVAAHRPPVAPARNPAGCVIPAVVGLVVLGVVGFALVSSGALTGVPFLGLELDGAPSVATIDLSQVPTEPLRADASGSYAASGLGATCRGYLPRTPQFTLHVTGGASVRVGARDAANDLVMAIHAADGTWLCDDDSGGSRMPLITASLGAGDHRVFVGPYSQGEGAPFTLVLDAQTGGPGVEATTRGLGLLPTAPPQIGEIQLEAGPLDAHWPGHTTGWVEASTIQADCRGSLPAAPHLRIHTETPREVELVTRDNLDEGGGGATVDLVMLVQGPDGRVLCDDDSGGGLNPRVRAHLEPGLTNVWVGVFHEEARATFDLALEASAAAAAPLPEGQAPVLGIVSLDSGSPRGRFAGEVSPDQPIEALGADCGGFVGLRPDLLVQSTSPRELTLTARGAPTLRLVLRGPDGATTCVERHRGTTSVRYAFAPGATQVWVGDLGRSRRSFELLLQP